MQNLRVTLVQTTQAWENIEENLRHFSLLLDGVENTDLIVLPEMFQTSFSMNVSLAEDWNDSKTLSWLKEKALKMKCAFYTSFMVQDEVGYRNRGTFVFPDGKVEFYDKQKGFSLAKEDQFFSSGNERKIVEYRGWKLQLQICYDLRFPEIMRNELNVSNDLPLYDVLLFVANWPQKRIAHWSALLKARAVENQCFAIGVNRVGMDGNDFAYNGQSEAVDYNGDSFSHLKDTDSFQTVVLNKNALLTYRNQLPFLKDQGND